MFTHGRTMLQASIDERCEVLSRLVATVPNMIHEEFDIYSRKAEDEAKANSDGDNEVYISMYHSFLEMYRPDDESWMIDEFYRSMVMSICSFAEGTVRSVLSKPDKTFKRNYLCSAIKELNTRQNLGLKEIDKYWGEWRSFIKKRNEIAHSKCEVSATPQELYEAIDGVHYLLRSIADAIDIKQRAEKSH